MIEFMINKPRRRPQTNNVLLLAHGAGAPMDSDFMSRIAEGVAENGIVVYRFNFPYMNERVKKGHKRSPDPVPKLLKSFRQAIDMAGDSEQVVIGGKSLGGRMASLLATELAVPGLVCLGYPFHAPGKPDTPRIEHFSDITAPTLIVQGTRDPFGKKEEVEGYGLPRDIIIYWLEDGDHDFRPRKASGLSYDHHLQTTVTVLAKFVLKL